METGDLIEHEGVRWMVQSRDALARTVKLSRGTIGEAKEIGDDDSAAKVVANPAKTWPFIPGTTKPKHGKITSILLSRGKKMFELEFLVDWVPSNFQRPGGPIFFRPELQLRNGEVLIAVHADDVRIRMPVTRSFGTVSSRQAKALAKQTPPSVFDHLMKDNDGFDDD